MPENEPPSGKFSIKGDIMKCRFFACSALFLGCLSLRADVTITVLGDGDPYYVGETVTLTAVDDNPPDQPPQSECCKAGGGAGTWSLSTDYVWTNAEGSGATATLDTSQAEPVTVTVAINYVWTCSEGGAKSSTNSGSNDFDVADLEFKLEIEKVGGLNTVIEPKNNYSENTKIKATAVFAADSAYPGQVCTDFEGTVDIGEDGTAVYAQGLRSGAYMTPNIVFTKSDQGVKTFIVKSLVAPKKPFLELPDAAKIKTANYPVQEGKSLVVPQWVDLNNNGRVDWCEQWSDAILAEVQKSKGEKGLVALAVSGIGGDFFELPNYGQSKAYRPISSRIIQINPTAPGHRFNLEKCLVNTVLHEARHVYEGQAVLTSPPGAVNNDAGDLYDDPNNDDDPGPYSINWPIDGDQLIEIGTFEDESLIIDQPPRWKGDGVKDEDKEKIIRAQEDDAVAFADQYK